MRYRRIGHRESLSVGSKADVVAVRSIDLDFRSRHRSSRDSRDEFRLHCSQKRERCLRVQIAQKRVRCLRVQIASYRYCLFLHSGSPFACRCRCSTTRSTGYQPATARVGTIGRDRDRPEPARPPRERPAHFAGGCVPDLHRAAEAQGFAQTERKSSIHNANQGLAIFRESEGADRWSRRQRRGKRADSHQEGQNLNEPGEWNRVPIRARGRPVCLFTSRVLVSMVAHGFPELQYTNYDRSRGLSFRAAISATSLKSTYCVQASDSLQPIKLTMFRDGMAATQGRERFLGSFSS